MSENNIYDNLVKGKNLDHILELEKNKARFHLTVESLSHAVIENDTEKFKYLCDKNYCKFDPHNILGNWFIDESLENGNEKMAKMLVTDFGCKPSLFAKQMAHVNAHHSLAFWMDSYATLRNQIDIKAVYHNYKTREWDNVVPKEYRY